MSNYPACVICHQPMRVGEPFDYWDGEHLHRECAASTTRKCRLCNETVTYTLDGNWIHPNRTVWCDNTKESSDHEVHADPTA